MGFLIVAIIIIFIYAFLKLKIENKKEDKKIEELNNNIQFNPTNNIEQIIELDENRKLFKLCRTVYSSPSKIYKYSDILDYELLEERNKDIIHSIKIKITLNDIQNPMLIINLLSYKLNTKTISYKNLSEKTQKILSTLNIMKNNSEHQIDSTNELLKYKKMLDENIITQEEFDAKKKELLNL